MLSCSLPSLVPTIMTLTWLYVSRFGVRKRKSMPLRSVKTVASSLISKMSNHKHA